MTEIHTMREIENLEEQNRKLNESLTACKLEVNKLRADQREADEEFSLLQNDLGQALIEIENLRLALEVAANDLEDWGAYTKAKNARTALEGK